LKLIRINFEAMKVAEVNAVGVRWLAKEMAKQVARDF
jgi:hypothetical protein